MIILMEKNATDEALSAVVKKIREAGLQAHISKGPERIILDVLEEEGRLSTPQLEMMPGVERAIRVVKKHKLVSRQLHSDDTIIEVRGYQFGGKQLQVIAGPCSVETQEQMNLAAQGVIKAGCHFMRGGAFKPRSSPYAFQGLGVDGLVLLKKAADQRNLPVVTELMDVRMLDTFLELDIDVIQIGARNMQNFDLLREVGRTTKPIILKRGLSATINEWLLAAEYIALGGNQNIIFCERGIRSFETAYRNVLDISAIAVLKRETYLPVIVDPSHAGGKAWMVPSLAQAAIAAGADGLLIEMHPKPSEALCDAEQALTAEELKNLMEKLKPIAQAIDRDL